MFALKGYYHRRLVRRPYILRVTLIWRTKMVYPGFNKSLKQGNVNHPRLARAMMWDSNQISLCEENVACGNGEQILSRDIYHLRHRFNFFRMLSCYFTTISSMMVVIIVYYFFLYRMFYLSLRGLEASIMKQAPKRGNNPLRTFMASQSAVQLGLLMTLHMVMENGLQNGLRTALDDIIIMQLHLYSTFFTFSLRT